MIELIEIAMDSIFAMAILDGIQIPSIYKYGAEKGRMHMVRFIHGRRI